MAVDPKIGFNNFNKPKILTPTETAVSNFLTLLLGKPGFYPSLPLIGMDIKRYLYSFSEEISAVQLKTEILSQCSDFMDEITSDNFDVVTSEYQGNLMLVFKLPVINDINALSAIIGVTTDDNGNIIYNFVEDTTQIL